MFSQTLVSGFTINQGLRQFVPIFLSFPNLITFRIPIGFRSNPVSGYTSQSLVLYTSILSSEDPLLIFRGVGTYHNDASMQAWSSERVSCKCGACET